MNLTVKERIIILSLLPAESSIFIMRAIRKLKESLSFSEKEYKDYDFTTSPDRLQVHWDEAKAKPKSIEFTPELHKLIETKLLELDKASKITSDMVDIYDRFILSKTERKQAQKEGD